MHQPIQTSRQHPFLSAPLDAINATWPDKQDGMSLFHTYHM
jgi:hypothetical protein